MATIVLSVNGTPVFPRENRTQGLLRRDRRAVFVGCLAQGNGTSRRLSKGNFNGITDGMEVRRSPRQLHGSVENGRYKQKLAKTDRFSTKEKRYPFPSRSSFLGLPHLLVKPVHHLPAVRLYPASNPAVKHATLKVSADFVDIILHPGCAARSSSK